MTRTGEAKLPVRRVAAAGSNGDGAPASTPNSVGNGSDATKWAMSPGIGSGPGLRPSREWPAAAAAAAAAAAEPLVHDSAIHALASVMNMSASKLCVQVYAEQINGTGAAWPCVVQLETRHMMHCGASR